MKNTVIALMIFSMGILFGCGDGKRTLYLYSWSDYIDPEIILDFEREYGCNVSVTTFDSNESAYAKLKAGATGYDVMIPSSYMIGTLADEGMIEKLDHSRLPTVNSNFCHRFDSQIYDPKMEYSVPYLVTYAGVMYDRNAVTNMDGIYWRYLETSKHKFSLLDDMREVLGIGLMCNGYSLNSENPEELRIAVETVLRMKRNVRKFDSESYKTEIPSGSLKLGHGYSTDAFQIIIGEDEDSSREDIGFVLPKEGFTIAFDEMVILENSGNKDLGYLFIDFMYRPENALRNMIYNFSPTPNTKAIEDLPEKYRKTIILDDETISRGQVLRAFKGRETNDMYNKAWDEICSIEK